MTGRRLEGPNGSYTTSSRASKEGRKDCALKGLMGERSGSWPLFFMILAGIYGGETDNSDLMDS